MSKFDTNKIDLYLTAVYNDLDTYLDKPHEFDSEFFIDIKYAVKECLHLIERNKNE
jgi:hypothetical protein